MTAERISSTSRRNHKIEVPDGTIEGELGKWLRRRSMMKARLAYAARGWSTFPAPPNGLKKSLKSKTRSNGVNWGATTDPEVIQQEFRELRFRNQNAGIATGVQSGIIVVETDNAEHGKDVDGEAALKAKYGKMPKTLEAISPSGSRHRYFLHPGAGIKIKTSASELAPGVDVRGDLGMVLAPPSNRPAKRASKGNPAKAGGVYRWLNDHPIAKLPKALLDAMIDTRPPKTATTANKTKKADRKKTTTKRNPYQQFGDSDAPPADKAEVAFALSQISPDCHYTPWMEIGAGLGDEFGDADGFELFKNWSRGPNVKCEKYNAAECRKKWKDFYAMNEFSIASVFHYATEDNPNWRDEWERERLSGAQSKSQNKTKKKKADDNDEDVPIIIAKPFVLRDPKSIPRRDWLYGRHLIRKFASATIAAGGVGKSSLMLIRALALVTGRALLGDPIPKRCKVWYWNGEDPYEEIERRVAAACLHYGIKPENIAGRLFINSGRVDEIVIAQQGRNGAVITVPVVEALEMTIIQNQIDVVMIDPFIASHRVSENDNNSIEMVAKVWTQLADATNTSIDLAHHIRKLGGNEATIADARGAGALIDAARSSEVLNVMTKEEAEKAGVMSPRGYFRINDGKMNLAPASDKSDWYFLESVDLGNGLQRKKQIEQGDLVGVVTCWSWPNPLDGIKHADFEKVAKAIFEGKWRENVQAKFWVGYPIGKALGLNPHVSKSDKAKVKGLISAWLREGKLIRIEEIDPKRRESKVFIRVAEKA